MFYAGKIYCRPVTCLSEMEGGGDIPVDSNAVTTKATGMYLWYLSQYDRIYNRRYCLTFRR
jgi:hypothetical protein